MTDAQTPTREQYESLERAWNFFNDRLFGNDLGPPLITMQRRRGFHGYHAPDLFVSPEGRTVGELALNPEYFATCSIEDTLAILVHEQGHAWQAQLRRVNGKTLHLGYHDVELADRLQSLGIMLSATGKPGGDRTGFKMSHYIIDGGLFAQHCADLVATGFRIPWMDRHIPVSDRLKGTGQTVEDSPALGSGQGVDLLTPPDNPSASDAAAAAKSKKSGRGRRRPEPPPELPSTSLSEPMVRRLSAPEMPKDLMKRRQRAAASKTKYVCETRKHAVWGKPGLRISCVECETSFKETPSMSDTKAGRK